MTKHTHKADDKMERGPFGFRGTAAGAHYTSRGENRKAHGGVLWVQACRCGAMREVNSNGTAKEFGAWTVA